MVKTAECKRCGKLFERKTASRHYCSPECRIASERERQLIRAKERYVRERLAREKENRKPPEASIRMPKLERMAKDDLLHYGRVQALVQIENAKR